MDLFKSIDEKLEERNKSQQVCPRCHGKKIVHGEVINILNICPRCSGYGELDWVQYATGNARNESNKDLAYNLAVKNSQVLAHKIQQLFMSTGIMVKVSVKAVRPDVLSKLYHSIPESEMIIDKELISI